VESKYEMTLRAVTFVNTQLDTPDEPLNPITRLMNPITRLMLEQAAESDEDTAKLLTGLTNLSVILLSRLEKATGMPQQEILKDVTWRLQRMDRGPGA